MAMTPKEIAKEWACGMPECDDESCILARAYLAQEKALEKARGEIVIAIDRMMLALAALEESE